MSKHEDMNDEMHTGIEDNYNSDLPKEDNSSIDTNIENEYGNSENEEVQEKEEYVENWKINRGDDSEDQDKRLAKFIAQCCLVILGTVFLTVAMVYSMTKKDKNSTASSKNKSENQVENSDESTKNKDNDSDDEETTKKEKEDKKDKYVYPVISPTYCDISEDIPGTFVSVYDVDENVVLTGRYADTRMYPASMTKVMTLIVAVENIKDLNERFTMTAEIIDPLFVQQASCAGFDPGESVSALDMLYGLILPSGADAAVGLATMVAGSEENFVKLMNDKCKEMGLKDTHFTNVSGLHNDEHYTTAIEQAYIMAYAMKNETCAEILGTYQHTTEATPNHPEGILLTSTMYGRMYGNEVPGMTICGGKTGYTQEARQCLVCYGKRNSDGHAYVAVTAHADGKWDCIYNAFKIFNMFTDVQGEIATIAGGHDD